MKFSVFFVSLITMYIIPMISSQNSSKGPECVGCAFFGATPRTCGELTPAACLPAECEALYFYWIHTDTTLKIIDYTSSTTNRVCIDDLDTVGKPIYLYYGRSSHDDWIPALDCISQDGGEKLKTEMTVLKTYLDQFKNIAGLILVNLIPDPYSTVKSDITTNFKTYLDELKKTFPNLAIGMEIIGRVFIDLYTGSTPPTWMDFKCIDPCVDFYILDLYYFNDCTEELLIGGASPICDKKARTLDQFIESVKKASMSTSKCYFGFRTGPTPITPGEMCHDTYTQFCKNPKDGYCFDNTQSYYDKGAYAKKTVAGFVMSNMDVADDPNGVCLCGGPYPAFQRVLAGFKGAAVPKPCPKFDKC